MGVAPEVGMGAVRFSLGAGRRATKSTWWFSAWLTYLSLRSDEPRGGGQQIGLAASGAASHKLSLPIMH